MSFRSAGPRNQIRREAHEWRDRTASDALSELEARAFEAWLSADVRHEQAYDRAITVWSAIDYLNAEDIDPDLMQASGRESTGVIPAGWLGRLAMIRWQHTAATLGVLLFLPLLFWSISQDPVASLSASDAPSPVYRYVTEIGEVRVLTLPDGTRASLGAATELTYVEGESMREARLLRGEVFLEVTADSARPFRVEANDLVTTVIGTAFEVRHIGGVSRVAVVEGEVSVTFPLTIGGRRTGQLKRVSLTPGLKASAEPGEGLSDAQRTELADIGAWRDQRLVYDGATLSELLTDIQRYSGLNVMIDPALTLQEFGKVSASFNSRDIETMTEMLPDLCPVSLDRPVAGHLRISPAHSGGP